jgi:predicted amino acid dehydrogenase
MKKAIRLMVHTFRDLFVRILPDMSDPDKYGYAFLVHPRNLFDVTRKYPFFKYLPDRLALFLITYWWPVILSEVTGIVSQKTGKPVRGWVIAITLTADQMLENRELALKRIIQAAVLARKSGAKIIGLGALTSSLTKGGLDLVGKANINVTTGHAYTAYTVTQNLFTLADYFGVDRKVVTLAIVGATGSVGSTSAQLAVRAGFTNILLIDLERKKDKFPELVKEMKSLNGNAHIEISYQAGDVKKADFIITATNAVEAVVRSEYLKPGAVVIDDAQPSDVEPAALKREDVLVVEAGVVHTPGVLSHFNFGLKDKYDNYCCMSEVLILASNEWSDHYVINRANVKIVDEISEKGKKLGFRLAEFQNFQESIKKEKLENIKRIIQNNAVNLSH